jgi:hypothetical protein
VLSEQPKRNWNIDFVVDDFLALDAKGFYRAEKIFFEDRLPSFLASNLSKTHSLAICRFYSDEYNFQTLEEFLSKLDWYNAVGSYERYKDLVQVQSNNPRYRL